MSEKSLIAELAWNPQYKIADEGVVLTPALVVYPEIIASNIDRTLALLGGDPDRWRPHIKTAKLGYTLRMMVKRGVRNFKCATTLELLLACESGAADVLLAYPVMGANAQRVLQISGQFPNVRISALIESQDQFAQWTGSRIGVFVDINSGMNRTGVEDTHADDILALVKAVSAAKLDFRGLHYYDGHYGSVSEAERSAAAQQGYRRLMKIIEQIEKAGIAVAEVITSGTPTFPTSASFEGFRNAKFIHRTSPGTIVYGDATSMAQLDPKFGFQPAVLVVSRVVSHPRGGIATCDAGHKAVSADAGVPTCIVMGHAELTGLGPSEEHLPLAIKDGATAPPLGEFLYLLPRHICPTVNLFDEALIVRNGQVESVEKVSARGRETPLLAAAGASLFRA